MHGVDAGAHTEVLPRGRGSLGVHAAAGGAHHGGGGQGQAHDVEILHTVRAHHAHRYRFNDRLSRCIHKSYEDLGYFDPGCRSGFEYYGRSVICSWRVDPTKSGFAKLDSAIGMQY